MHAHAMEGLRTLPILPFEVLTKVRYFEYIFACGGTEPRSIHVAFLRIAPKRS
jgi:hypothetical protein